MRCSTLLTLIIWTSATLAYYGEPTRSDCPCGWYIPETGEIYTDFIYDDFTYYPNTERIGILKDPNSDNPDIRLNAKYDTDNLWIKFGFLFMRQKAYSKKDLEAFKPVSIAGIQSHRTDILHGTFRSELRVRGYHGGSCASFFWYHDDRSELDIEMVTPGTSLVNDTINWTTHPSVDLQGRPIPNATYSRPLNNTADTYATHRFDCDPVKGVKYYLNDDLVHEDHQNIPHAGGSLQLKLWADGNKWWSGAPSNTEVLLQIRSIIAYFNTTSSLNDTQWAQTCAQSGKSPCKARLKRFIEHYSAGTQIYLSQSLLFLALLTTLLISHVVRL